MAQWSKAFGRRNAFSGGFDFRWVEGESQEAAYVASVPTVITPFPDGCPAGLACGTQAATQSVQRFSGGSQQSLGAFVQDIFTPIDKLVLTLSARVDRWNNYNGHNLETTVAGLPTVNNRPSIPDTNDTVLSPHLGALYHASDRVSLWGAANSGFRAPTLTELYRQFSVGAITTRPNENLAPERLVGGEAGINVAPARNVSVRLTWFGNRIKNPVANITLNATTAQKQNLPETRVNGFQTDIDYRIGTAWRFSGGYIYDDAKVTDGGTANAILVGKVLQQVPRHRGSFQVAYASAKIATVALSVQSVGLQYNDDLNVNFIPVPTLAAAGYDASYPAGLPGYTAVDLSVSRNIGSSLQVFFGVQNLLDKEYFVQTNPSTIGTPRLVNGGVRVRFSGR
jgi:outer membrane receptor protein involved in Fe transport